MVCQVMIVVVVVTVVVTVTVTKYANSSSALWRSSSMAEGYAAARATCQSRI